MENLIPSSNLKLMRSCYITTLLYFRLSDLSLIKIYNKHISHYQIIILNSYITSLYLISGSWDGTVNVYKLSNFELTSTIICDKKFVCSVAVHDYYIISGTLSGLIQFWNTLDNYNLVGTVSSRNTKGVFGLVTMNHSLISVSEDGKICRWRIADILEGKSSLLCIETEVDAHNEYIYSVCCCSNFYLFTGGGDKIVKIWDVSSSTKITLITSIALTNPIKTLAVKGVYLFVGIDFTSVFIYNIRDNFQMFREIQSNHSGSIVSLCVWENHLITAGLDAQIIITNWETNEIVRKIKSGHIPRSLCIKNGCLFVGMNDNTIKVIDMAQSYSLVRTLKDHKLPIKCLI